MTPEAQRIAIAEACGWSSCNIIQGDPMGRPVNTTDRFIVVPDYVCDLNAMHEAEELFYAKADTLEGAERMRDYSDWVCQIVKYPLRATAAQRAEAFLRTIGRWEEETKP